MSPLAKLSELTDALEFESVDRRTYFDRHTGRIVSVADGILSAVEEGEDEALTSMPDWQKEEVETARAIVNHSGDRFIDPPGKFEFNEYRHMERFIGGLHPPGSDTPAAARRIPENFLDGFRDRDCATMDCQACGYCERIAAQAVSISPEYRTEVLRKYAEMDNTMVTGGLWGV